MADLKISELPELLPGQLNATDPLAIADLSASTTKKVTALDLVRDGITLLPNGAIPGEKVNFVVPTGSVTTASLADKAVTAPKLADFSTANFDATTPATGEYIGQLWIDLNGWTSAAVWDGTQWNSISGVVNVNGSTTGLANIYATRNLTSPEEIDLSVDLDNTSAAGQFLAGPSGSAGAISYRRIESPDLPTAGVSKGAVAVTGNGLAVAGDVLTIDNNVALNATDWHLVQYNEYGLVTDGRKIAPPDLPIATDALIGAVRPGTDLTVDVTGTLGHTNTIVAGVGTRVLFDVHGHITSAEQLLETDIPDLPASKITSGTFTSSRIQDDSITADKLADYATAYIQDHAPPNTGNTIGQLWLNPLAQQIRMWDGNVWVPIGVGALSEQNLRFCGLFDASTGKITVLTEFGRNAGFKAGDVIPTATDQLTGAYFVADTAGNGTAVTPGVNYDASDWIVCLGVAQGWSRIDVAGSGGGGGSSTLDGLIDVSASSPGAGQALIYDGTVWRNTTIASATEVVSGLIELATDAEVVAGTDTVRAVVPKTLADNYLAKNIANLPALPA